MNRSRNFAPTGRSLNVPEDKIDEIMNSDYFREVRLQMLNGEVPLACQRCFLEEAKGVRSKRVAENTNFPMGIEEARAITSEDGTIKPKLRFVELRLGNICNVKCRTCNPASSSKWKTEYTKMENDLDFVRRYTGIDGFDWPEKPEFWSDLEQYANDIDMLYINGGEPTLIKEHWRFLERLADSGHADHVTLWYNINMTTLPDHAFDLWRRFRAVQVTCSIDDLGLRNQYLRHGTHWSTVESNLDRLLNEKWIEVSVNQTISYLNAYYLPDYHAYMAAKGLHVHLNYVYDPEYLAPWHLPSPIKADIVDRLRPLMPGHILEPFANQLLETRSDPDLLRKGLEYNRYLDRSRNESAEQTFPELYEALRREGSL
jgi:MoaA/NifB/PqqE/SkfB family radical SAM enzyme